MGARPKRFRRYPAYKHSGVTWLGEIPAHWESKALKRSFGVVSGSTPKSGEPDNWNGDIPWVTPDDLGQMSGRVLNEPARKITRQGYESCGTKMVDAGSLILSTRAPIGHLAISGTPVCTNQGCRSLVSRHACSEQYFYFQLLAIRPVLEAAGRGSTFKELAKGDLETVLLFVPPIDEQRAIASFLDRETAKIDGLVKRKERLIALLQEKRTALITRAVTRGLDPNVTMKDSGVEWLGEIPAHWDVKRIKNVSAFVTSGSRGWADFYSDEGPCFLRIGNMQSGSIDLNIDKVQHVDPPPGSEGERTRVRPGDVLVSITALIGAVALVPENLPEAFVNQHIALIRPSASDVDSRWMAYCIMSPVGQTQFSADLYGGTKDGLELNDVRSLMVLAPPICEQERIVAYLDSHTKKLMNLVKAVQTAIDLLKEFRTALISAAVTGKIDVREEAA